LWFGQALGVERGQKHVAPDAQQQEQTQQRGQHVGHDLPDSSMEQDDERPLGDARGGEDRTKMRSWTAMKNWISRLSSDSAKPMTPTAKT